MTQRTFRKRLHGSLAASVREDLLLEIEMLLLTFSTGMIDAATFGDFRCFVSNQTGNTVLFAITVFQIGNNFVTIPHVGMSLGLFIVGCWAMGQLGNYAGCRRRWWLIFNSIIQTLLIYIAAIVAWTSHGMSGNELATDPPTRAAGMVMLGLLAFSAGGQVTMARALQMTDITTANATSSYIDTFIDKDLYALHNRRRNRRIAFLVTLITGSFAGAVIDSKHGAALTLALSGIGKGIVTALFCLNGEEVDDVTDEEEGKCESTQKKGATRNALFIPLFIEAFLAESH